MSESINKETLLLYINKILKSFLTEDVSVYLFGSYAKDTQNNNSDIDLLIITSGEQTNPKEIVRTLYKSLVSFQVDYDIIGYSKVDLLNKIKTNSFFKNIIKEGVLLHGQRVA